MSEILNEFDALRDKLCKEKSYRREVEEERDFLLADNTRLRAELERLKQNSDIHNRSLNSTQASGAPAVKSVSTVETKERSYAHILRTKINEACGGKNAVCTSFMPYSSVQGIGTESDSDIWLCGGVDAHVSGYDSETNAHLFSIKLSAPVLTIDVHGASIACGMMDGSHTIINVLSKGNMVIASEAVEHHSNSPDPSNTCTDSKDVSKVVRKHTKYVVLVRWSPDGRFLVTVSHDLQVILYRRCSRTDCMEEFKIFMCANTPESACFVPATCFSPASAELEVDDGESEKSNAFGSETSTIGDYLYTLSSSKKSVASVKEPKIRMEEGGSMKSFGDEGVSGKSTNYNVTGGDAELDTWDEGTEYDLILGMRDTAHLTYINCTTFQSREVSLNENAWDTHASFVPLYLTPSPCGGRLLVATDKHMHVVLRTGTNVRLQILSGHSCGDFGKPVVQWDWRGEYVFCNSDNDNLVYVYCMQLGKIVSKLEGHGKGLLRGLAAHPHKSQLLSVSYDRAMILWSA